MEWEVEFTGEFERWWNGLTEDEQDSVDRKVRLLRAIRYAARMDFKLES